MKIAVASGKGGTGKTLISTNLAHVASKANKVTLYDLDVEEPNVELFFESKEEHIRPVERMIPIVNEEVCDHCGICSQVCEFHAIITLANQVMVFPELCHSCYGCLEMCPLEAIDEGKKEIGRIKQATLNDSLEFVSGTLKVGESATTALIRETKNIKSEETEIRFFDAPPGTSCPLIETVKDMDYVLLVGEPTPFGVHDLNLVVQALQELGKAFGVVANKVIEEPDLLSAYCEQNGIEVIGRIPLNPQIARAYAQGKLVSEAVEGTEELFNEILQAILSKVKEATL